MKQLFRFLVLTTLLLLLGCNKEFDDSSLVGRLDNLESRVTRLEQLCQQMNTNISSLQSIVTSLQNNDYVTGVTPINENGKTIGYTISFTKSQPVTIYHGKDGRNGKDCDYLPVIGVKQDSDGIYYWTLDGKWLLDNSGNKVKAVGTDGKDGMTPLLKIEDNHWYVSYDNGASWIFLWKATGENGTNGADGESYFKDVSQDDSNVYLTLADGTTITIPKKVELSISLNVEDLVVYPNHTHNISFTITSATKSANVEVTSSADIKAKVVLDDENGLTGKIQIKTGSRTDEYSKVIVFVSNGEKVIMRSITFENAELKVEENVTKDVPAEGGLVTIEFLSNIPYEVVIPEQAKSWISIAPTTRALERQTHTLKIEANEGYYREATISVMSSDYPYSLEYNIEQDGEMGVDIDPSTIPDNEIWYTTNDKEPVSLTSDAVGGPNAEFNTDVIYNEYKNGKGIIKFREPVTEIRRMSFSQKTNLTSIYLPKTIRKIGYRAFYYCLNLEIVYINSDNLIIEEDSDNSNPFDSCIKLSKFIGPLSSDDRRCLIIDNAIYSFAPYDIKEYTTPQGVTQIKSGSFVHNSLKQIVISEGVKKLFSSFGRDNFLATNCLEYVYLPGTLDELDERAFMRSSENIKKFYGDCKFISDDGHCLIIDNYAFDNSSLTCFASGAGLTSYTIPEGVNSIESYAFYCAETLRELTFPSSLTRIASQECFLGTYNIEKIHGPNVLDDNRSLVVDGTLLYVAPKGIKEYKTPPGVTKLSYGVLAKKPDFESIIISDEVISVTDPSYQYEIPLGYVMWSNPNLKTVTISANMKILGLDPFMFCDNLETVYLRAAIPPIIGHNFPEKIPSSFPKLTIYVPQESLDAYKGSPDWAPYRGYLKGYNYTDLPENKTYISSDYSMNGITKTLQKAKIGNGIDIVLMGDAYSDRQITDGTYEADMKNLYENLFTEEPYKSFKDYFNVYYVNVVSATEGYEYNRTALGGYFGEGTSVGGKDKAVFNYALNAIPEERMDNALLIVAMNSNNYAGTCYMYYPETDTDYGKGVSVAYFPKGGDAQTFSQLLHHEACGHGFAKLADEYAYEGMGEVPPYHMSEIQSQQANWGWWKNVDFTSDLSAIRWKHFLTDTRYESEDLGAYEGGLTYWTGVWRPSENSIMRDNTGGFNAPSREAIYYRIHKLAYGDSWQYNYEDFVEWDARNRKTATISAKVYKPTSYKPTHPPVLVKKSWKNAE